MAKIASRSEVQHRSVEQIVDTPVAKVVEPVPHMIQQFVEVPKTVSRGRIQLRGEDRGHASSARG